MPKMESAPAPAPKSISKLPATIFAISAIVAILSGATLYLLSEKDSIMTCETIASPVLKDQYIKSISLSPKAFLDQECIDGLLEHKHVLDHLKIENYHNIDMLLSSLGEFSKLNTLELKNVNLKHFDLKVIAQNAQLKTLILDNNPGLEFYGETNIELVKLSVANCDLVQVPQAIYSLSYLEELNLRGNQISSDVDFGKLEKIRLYNDNYVK